jgi:hypothetical protein
MTTRTLAVLSAGLSSPSSTRLLADLVAARAPAGPADPFADVPDFTALLSR